MPKQVRNRLPTLPTLPTLAALMAFITFVVLVAAAGCSSTPTGVGALAGRYELRAVNGKPVPVDALGGAIAGELVLTVNGRASRTVTYARSGLPQPAVLSASGTYRVRGSEITLRLLEPGRPASSPTWDVRGDVRSSTIILGYPGPADGWIEEEYVRTGRG
jgi:hypothetical protein